MSEHWLFNRNFSNAAWIANCWRENIREYDIRSIDFKSYDDVRAPKYPLTQKDKQFILRVYKAMIFNIFE